MKRAIFDLNLDPFSQNHSFKKWIIKKGNVRNNYVVLIALLAFVACNTTKHAEPVPPARLTGNIPGKGQEIEIRFTKGGAFNHPSFAIWVESTDGVFIQTLFVTKSYATGIFEHGKKEKGQWVPGPVIRPATLPYWSHKVASNSSTGPYIPSKENPVPDAFTGATPAGSFVLSTRASMPLGLPLKVMMEINQTWDFNDYWTNNKFPGNQEYISSCQPALVYSALVQPSDTVNFVELKPIGHSHYAGSDGSLTPGLGTFTTALEIAAKIEVVIKNQDH